MYALSSTADQIAAQVPGLSRDQLLEIAGTVIAAQPKQRAPHIRKEVEPEHRCCARVWGTGSGQDQCSKSKLDGSDYCKSHASKHAECSEPCQLDHTGKRLGLFCGDIRTPLVGTSTDGSWVVTWNDAELKTQMAAEKEAATFKFHPWAPNSGELALSKKKGSGGGASAKASKVKTTHAPKTSKVQANKPVKGKTAYICFIGEQRAEIKLELQGGDPSVKISQPQIAKVAGPRWKSLDLAARGPYVEMAALDKAQKIAAWEAENEDTQLLMAAKVPEVGTSLTLAAGWDHAPVGLGLGWGKQGMNLTVLDDGVYSSDDLDSSDDDGGEDSVMDQVD